MIYLEGAEDTENRLASLLAVHLVSQILDEAYIIASEAKDSGEPWEYLSMLRSFQVNEIDEDDVYDPLKNDTQKTSSEHYNVVVTSTPQKDPDDKKKAKSEANFIGQGDEDLGLAESDHSQASSTLLDNMFDMSEVIRVEAPDQRTPEQSEYSDVTNAMTKILESYVDKACDLVSSTKTTDCVEALESTADVKQEDYSDYTFLVDVFGSTLDNNVGFYLDDALAAKKIKPDDLPEAPGDDDDDDNKSAPPDYDQLQLHLPTVDDATLSNIDAYLTLNHISSKAIVNTFQPPLMQGRPFNRKLHSRAKITGDYEQCSDDDGDPILQDPKGLSMQEITLLTANTSLQDLSFRPDFSQEPKKLVDAATSDISESIVIVPVVKKTLVKRCRLQGARILACLRGWWRRRTPGKRNEPYNLGGRCPCPPSPLARRRSATLTTGHGDSGPYPQPSRDTWKFNTISEALLNVSHWKDYVYTTPGNDESGDID